MFAQFQRMVAKPSDATAVETGATQAFLSYAADMPQVPWQLSKSN
jgi:hypothetical protein